MYNTHVMCRYAFLHCLRRWAPRLDKGSPSGINHLASTQNQQRSKRKSVKLGMSSADDDCPQYVYIYIYTWKDKPRTNNQQGYLAATSQVFPSQAQCVF